MDEKVSALGISACPFDLATRYLWRDVDRRGDLSSALMRAFLRMNDRGLNERRVLTYPSKVNYKENL